MSDSPPIAKTSTLPASAHDRTPGAEEASALLTECGREFRSRLFEATRASLDLASDLFESPTGVPDGEIESFRAKRGEWLERFERAVNESLTQWQAGHRRSGRRPDRDASAASLSVMTPLDQEKQAALVESTAFLRRFTRREHDALDARVGVLAPAQSRIQDNPFGPDYVLDALGVASRSTYPSPHVWRSLMVRLLADLAPTINKIYISQNRILADHGVLPDMKAALRARSEFRPANDKDLLPTFSRMLSEVGALPTDIAIPALSGPGGLATTSGGASMASTDSAVAAITTVGDTATKASVAAASAAYLPAPVILSALAALAELAKGRTAAEVANASSAQGGDFPDLDPMMALGTSTPLFATLGHWQRLDLPVALQQALPPQVPG